jgi:hypothetical protein
MNQDFKLTEARRRERKEFHKHILCYRADLPSNAMNIKIPFVFEVHDISYSGMGIFTSVMLFPGTEMFFRLDSDDIKREFHVKVVWCKYNGYQYTSGIQFLDVTREDIIFLHLIFKNL